ncbi:MAG: alpha/beta hydrolase [Sulfitobacter sp.]
MTWTTQPRSNVSAEFGALSYVRMGSGAPLVLIHGVGLLAESWAGVIPGLAYQFTVYAIDMPGHGASPLAGEETLDDYAARIVSFITRLEGSICIAGHSMGAALAVHIAGLMPEKICAVAALNAIYRRSDAAKDAVQKRATALRGATDPTPTLIRWFGATPEGKIKAAALACDEWLRSGDADGYANAYKVFASHDGPTDTSLAALKMPALFMTGAHDLNSTPAMSQAMAKMAPLGQTHVSDTAAHMMPMTHCGDVGRVLSEFFENAGGKHVI